MKNRTGRWWVVGLIGVFIGGMVGPLGTAASPSGAANAQWQVSASYFPPSAVSDVSCADDLHCLAVGGAGTGGSGVLSTTNGGATWSREFGPSGQPDLRGVSCASTTFCMAVNLSGPADITANGGQTWTLDPLPTTDQLSDVSCASPTTCLVSSYQGMFATTNGGSSWTQQTLPSGIVGTLAVACPSTADCYAIGIKGAIGDEAIQTTNGGVTWTLISSVQGFLENVACATTSFCVFNDTQIAYETTDGGTTWTQPSLPAVSHTFDASSCAPDSDDCMVGGIGEVVATTNQTSWGAVSLPSPLNDLIGASCPSAGICFAYAANNQGQSQPEFALTADNGDSWILEPTPLTSYAFGAVACASSTNCLTIDNPPFGTVNGGATWFPVAAIPGNPNILAVTCPGPSTCVGVGANGSTPTIVTTVNDSWTTQSVPAGSDTLFGVACPNINDCVAVGGNDLGSVDVYTTDGGVVWSAGQPPAGVTELDAVACSSAADCVAVSSAGPIITTDNGGATWTSTATPNGVTDLSQVVCPSASECLAIGQYSGVEGTAIIRSSDGGETWGVVNPPAGNSVDYGSSFALACLSVSSCEASSPLTGMIGSTDGGSTWTAQALPAGTGSIAGLTCTSVECLATGGNDDVVNGDLTGGLILSIPQSSLAITTTTLPAGTVGVAYHATLQAANGSGGNTWSITGGALPAGLSLSASTGQISGEPTAAGTSTATFTVTDSNGDTASSQLALTVGKAASTTTISVSPTSISPGQPFSMSATVSGEGAQPTGTVTFSAGSTILCTTSLGASTNASCGPSAVTTTSLITATYNGDANFLPSSASTTLTVVQPGSGYWLVASDGGIFSFGNAQFYGSTGSIHLNKAIVGMAATPDRKGYWLVASDGGIFSFGDAQFYGSTGSIHLNKPIVGMAATPDGEGYWLVASDGGIFTFGDARFEGSLGGGGSPYPVVGMAATVDGNGYWIANAKGTVYALGSAATFGDADVTSLATVIAGMATTPDSHGYWLASINGAVSSFGDVGTPGNLVGFNPNKPIVGIAATRDGDGFWLVGADGGIFTYGTAQYSGSTGSLVLNKPVVGMAPS